MEKKLDSKYTRMLRAILNKSWRQHSTKPQLYGHLPTITKTIKIRRTRQAGHSWRSRDELISDLLLWTPSHGRAKVGRPARTYLQQCSARIFLTLWHEDDDIKRMVYIQSLFFSFFFFIWLNHIKYSYLIQIIFKQSYLAYRWDPNRCHQIGSEWTLE